MELHEALLLNKPEHAELTRKILALWADHMEHIFVFINSGMEQNTGISGYILKCFKFDIASKVQHLWCERLKKVRGDAATKGIHHLHLIH